jgi:hypothetical protein
MRWIRGNIRHASWLALLALAINFALSFGHTHFAGPYSENGRIIAAVGVSDHANPLNHSDHPDYLCPICLAASAIGNGLASTSPAIPLQLSETFADRPVEPVRLAVASPRASFQPRGPPLS